MKSEKTVFTEWRKLDDNLYHPFDPNNGVICDKGFVKVDVFCEGIANVSDGNKWGCISCLGEILIPIKYDVIIIEEFEYAHFYIVCGRDGFFSRFGTIKGRNRSNVYTGIYDLYDFDGQLLIGGFSDYKYNEEEKLFSFLFGCVFEKRPGIASPEYVRLDGNSKWVILDKNFCLLLNRESVKGKIIDWKLVNRRKIAGEIVTDSDEFITIKNKRDATSALLIDLPEYDLFDQVEYDRKCSQLICKKDSKYSVVYIGKNNESSWPFQNIHSKYYDYVRPLTEEFTCILEKQLGIGVLRKGLHVLPCEYSYITKPVNNWCFAIKKYPFYPESTNVGCYFAVLLNVQHRILKLSDSYFYTDAIVAIQRIENEQMVEKLLSEGVFILYSLDDSNDGIESITVHKSFIHLFSKDFCEKIGDCHKLGLRKISTKPQYWASKEDMLYALEDHSPQYFSAIDDFSTIEDALEFDSEAYWNRD